MDFDLKKSIVIICILFSIGLMNLIFHSLKSKIEFSGNQFKNSTVLSPYHVITEGAEMEQGIYKIRFDLFVSGNHESDSKDLEGLVTSCETEFIYDEKSVLTETDQYSFRLLPGNTFNNGSITEQD